MIIDASCAPLTCEASKSHKQGSETPSAVWLSMGSYWRCGLLPCSHCWESSEMVSCIASRQQCLVLALAARE